MSIPNPCISVIMSVCNTEKYVGECIESILGQTFPDFEFIIINDASTDRTPEIISTYKDKRIIIINNRVRSYPTRNKGLAIAKGKYIAIMDADDVSMPERFERQVLFMDHNKEIGLSGTGFRVLGEKMDRFRESDYEKIKVQLMRNNCIIHPSMIIRHDLMKKYNLKYIRKYLYSSDYDLIARMARFFPVTNIPEVLMHHRVHGGMVSMKFRTRQIELANNIFINQLRYIGLNPNEEERNLHIDLLRGEQINYQLKTKLIRWIDKLKTANKVKGYYNENELDSFLNAFLFKQSFCRDNSFKHELNLKNNAQKELNDVTFLIPFRIKSDRDVEILESTIKYLLRNYITKVFLIEADASPLFPQSGSNPCIRYAFIKDEDVFLNRSKWINYMLNLAETRIVAIWDHGTIVPAIKLTEAVQKIRDSKADICFPHNGSLINCGVVARRLFNRSCDYEDILKITDAVKSEPEKNIANHVFIADRKKYLATGGECETHNDAKLAYHGRLKKFEAFNLSTQYSDNSLLTLHQTNVNELKNKILEKQNLLELLEICK